MPTDTLFDRIVRGDLPAHRVWEDDGYLAFLDARPVRPGHTLLIPKEAGDDVFRLSPDVYAGLWERARWLAEPLRSAFHAARVGVVVEGFGVPHAHVHLVPIDASEQLNPQAQREASDAELAAAAERIRRALSAAGV